jgi:hypothetical protein
VTPEGKSWLVSYGLKNLTHRDSDEAPQALEPGRSYDVSFLLFLVGHRFRRGNRIRVAISENLWPLAWPSPDIVTLSLALDHSRVSLPVRPVEASPSPFPIPIKHAAPGASPPPPPVVTTAPVSPGHYRIELDSLPTPFTWPDIGTTTSRGRWETVELIEGQTNSGRWRQEASSSWKREDWDCSLSAVIELTSTPREFVLSEQLTAKQGATVVFERRKDSRIPRNLV